LVTNLWSNEILIHINTHTFHPSFSDFVSVHWWHCCWTSHGGAWRTYCRAGDTQEDQGGESHFNLWQTGSKEGQTLSRHPQSKREPCWRENSSIFMAVLWQRKKQVGGRELRIRSTGHHWAIGRSIQCSEGFTYVENSRTDDHRGPHALSLNGDGYGTAHGHNLQYRPTFSHLMYTSH
jgi:hypothetical protein